MAPGAPPTFPRALNDQEIALSESGQTIFREAIENGRTFCKEMIGVSTGAIAIFYGLFAYLTPKDKSISDDLKIYVIAAPIAFLVAAVFYTLGYMPLLRRINLLNLTKGASTNKHSVEEVRSAKVYWSIGGGMLGTIVFGFGIVLASLAYWELATARAKPSEEAAKPQHAIILTTQLDATGQVIGNEVSCGLLVAQDGESVVYAKIAGETQTRKLTGVSEIHLVESCPSMANPATG